MSRAAGTVGQVYQGTCGWSDESLARCGRFYPSGVRTAEDRLATYSRHFPCVEVDSSCYAIPQAANVARWVAATPPGFLFHFKAFGAFAAGGAPANTLPAQVRAHLPEALQGTSSHVSLSHLPADAVDTLWALFHQALEPAVRGGRMGLVLFQFHLGFIHSEANKQHVLACRRRLGAQLGMAAEFRCRAWFAGEAALAELTGWLSEAGIVLVAADELHHETMQKDRAQTGLPPGQAKRIMPIALAVTNPAAGLYVRLHRRHGTADRLLPQAELQAWAERLASCRGALRGPIYFLWGTDWEDAPMVNARGLAVALPPELVFDWPAALKRAAGRGSIHAFLQRAGAPSAGQASTAAAGAAADGDAHMAAGEGDASCHASGSGVGSGAAGTGAGTSSGSGRGGSAAAGREPGSAGQQASADAGQQAAGAAPRPAQAARGAGKRQRLLCHYFSAKGKPQ